MGGLISTTAPFINRLLCAMGQYICSLMGSLSQTYWLAWGVGGPWRGKRALSRTLVYSGGE